MTSAFGQVNAQNLSSSFSGFFLTILSALTAEQGKFNDMGSKVYPNDYGPNLPSAESKPFDFIIVGAGPAGCVLANRLTENPHWTVLLLEAGDAPSTNTEIPYLYPTLTSTEDLWTFTTCSNNFCNGSPQKNCQFSRGKALGGSSTIGNLHYERGTHSDFNQFPNWDIRDITDSYERLEKYEGKQTMGAVLGTQGEVVLTDLTSDNDLEQAILASAKELSYDRIIYPEQELGFRTAIGTVVRGERNNFAKAFLGPIRSRPNLLVARKSLVLKILTNLPNDRRVTGVQVKVDTKTLEVKAKREVIICAGAINTAKLLLLSGFGPQEHLQKMGITPLVDLPVGKNLRDQIGLPMFVAVEESQDPACCEVKSKSKSTSEKLDSIYYYLAHREGKLAGTGLNNIVGAINTRKDPYSTPNIKIYHQFFETNDKTFVTYLESLGYKQNLINSLKHFNEQSGIIVFTPTLIRPESFGDLKLKDSQPSNQPIIKGNYLSDPEISDYYSLQSAYDFVQALIEVEPLAREHKAKFIKPYLDECNNYNVTTQQYVNCYIRSVGVPMGQVVGTAKMSDSVTDDDHVVNEELLVEGIRHLRIVDASVIPEPISANVECTVAMMGIKIAEDILKQWSKSLK